MKLQLNRKHIHPDLFEELSFDDYLKKFEIHLPFLSTMILSPLSKEEGLHHFENLSKILSRIESKTIDIEEVLSLSARILPLDNVLANLETGHVEQYQLYLIYTYITQELLLQGEETNLPLKLPLESLEKAKKLLLDFCEEGAKIIKLSEEEKHIKEKIYQSDRKLEAELQTHEKEISELTGLSLLYPYPRELLNPPSDLLDKIKTCPKLKIEIKGDVTILHHELLPEVKKMEEDVKVLRDQLETEIKKRLYELGQKLLPFFKDIQSSYEQRKQRAYLYALCHSIERFHFTIPDFVQSGFSIIEGHLPCLEKANLENYVPLDLDLSTEGSHVLFGANMAGKTSVLKTMYFLLTLVRLGLPLPVSKMTLRYPENIEIHLKNSGKIRQKLSGFADELNFFSKEFPSGTYLLIDELFHSTNPLAGLELSKVFLSHYNRKDLLLFCTSFYPEVLYMQGIHFYKMLDSSLDVNDEKPLEEVLSQTPFRVEKLEAQDVGKSFWESQQPLKLALHFPLDEELKKNIKATIKD